MNYAYDELYVPLAQRVMGDMYDYAVNTLKFSLQHFHYMFMVSGIAYQFEIGNPMYVAGKNGCEVAREVIEKTSDLTIDEEDVMYVDKSPEYWVGWALAYYQWHSGSTFKEIERRISIENILGMYITLHEADVTLFVEIMDEKMARSDSALARLRKYASLSQAKLAERSGVPLRQIQLFEQGQRDIKKTQGQTLYAIAHALNCRMEDLIV